MKNFEYVKPSTLREAIDLLGQCGPKAYISAGGGRHFGKDEAEFGKTGGSDRHQRDFEFE